MQIFALETNREKFNRSFLSADEAVILCVRFHPFLLLTRFLLACLSTAILVGVLWILWIVGVPLPWLTISGAIVWFFFIFLRIVGAYIDWRYDVVLLTNEKLVVVNQASIFRREIRQMNLENLASVTVETQFWNIFPFGVLCFDLKEGTGQRLSLTYIPHAAKVASVISDALTLYERRRTGWSGREVTDEQQQSMSP
ncbi:hypothetical protein HY285_05445 [Candidatus Peregrinibacteria bacterium]|nr:hypothetical protein [Candidatus Peregrinibacteria bacterium]MBI3816954.1 hypothetical protein [Candidatus Peregrinibacteria bacterium]